MCTDESFMRRAIVLGRRSLPLAGVNPAVGAVLAREGAVIGEGFHRGPGSPHAEAAAISEALDRLPPGALPRGTILYCTLEPCCHSGAGKRTPPCTEAIIAAGIERVVVAKADPNPLVAGRGIARLREGGIRVEEGLLADEAAPLIEAFSVSIRARRPFIRLKWAQSLDGRLACRGGASKWITNEKARSSAHELRSRHDAIMVGANTLRLDDPRLTVRDASVDGRFGNAMPRRIVLAGRKPLPLGARLFSPALREGSLVLAAAGSPAAEQCRAAGIPVLELPPDGRGLPDLTQSFRTLYDEGIGSVLVEGGSALFTCLLDLGLWDALTVFTAPLVLGEGIAAVGDLGIGSPDQGIRLEEVDVEAGEGFIRMDAKRQRAEIEASVETSLEDATCLRV